MMRVIAAPTSLELYTRTIEDLCHELTKLKDVRFVMHLHGGAPCGHGNYASSAALNRWELALAKLQKRKILLIAVVDSALCDLSLSLALACDLRLGTANASLPPPASRREHMPLPLWWLASLALHIGALRAQQLIWRRRAVDAAELLACGLLHAPLGDSATELSSMAASLPVPASAPLDLLRRIVLQGFSISGADQIGHSLAVSSLVITEAVGRASSALGGPLPQLVPLAFQLTQAHDAWTLEMSACMERVSLDELDGCMRALNRSLGRAAAAGGPLPHCLIIRFVASLADAESTGARGAGDVDGAEVPRMPIQLMQLHSGGQAWNMKLVKWLTKLEKALTTLATLPLPTVAHLCGDGGAHAGLDPPITSGTPVPFLLRPPLLPRLACSHRGVGRSSLRAPQSSAPWRCRSPSRATCVWRSRVWASTLAHDPACCPAPLPSASPSMWGDGASASKPRPPSSTRLPLILCARAPAWTAAEWRWG